MELEKRLKKRLQAYIFADPCADGSTILIASLLAKAKDVAEIIAGGYRSDLNAQLKSDGSTAFMLAVRNDYEDIAEEILVETEVGSDRHSYDIHLTDHNNNDALMVSCHNNCPELASLILERDNVSLTRRDRVYGQNAFMMACECYMSDVATTIFNRVMLFPEEELLEELRYEDADHYNMLHHALECADVELIQRVYTVYEIYGLVGVDDLGVLRIKGTRNDPLVVHAICCSAFLVGSTIFGTNWNVRVPDREDGTPLLIFAMEKYRVAKTKHADDEDHLGNLMDSILHLLKNAPLEVYSQVGKEGVNVLMYAIRTDLLHRLIGRNILKLMGSGTLSVSALASASASVARNPNPLSQVDKNGDTPLMYSIRCDRKETFDMILSGDCDVHHANKNGATALSYASEKGIHYLERIAEHDPEGLKIELRQVAGLMALARCLQSDDEKMKAFGEHLLGLNFEERVRKIGG